MATYYVPTVYNQSTMTYVLEPSLNNGCDTYDEAKRDLQDWLMSEANTTDNEADAMRLDDAAQQLNYANFVHIGVDFDWTCEVIKLETESVALMNLTFSAYANGWFKKVAFPSSLMPNWFDPTDIGEDELDAAEQIVMNNEQLYRKFYSYTITREHEYDATLEDRRLYVEYS